MYVGISFNLYIRRGWHKQVLNVLDETDVKGLFLINMPGGTDIKKLNFPKTLRVGAGIKKLP